MAAGFEARARITADVSSFVAGARSAARAAQNLAAATRTLSTNLTTAGAATRSAASAIQPLNRAYRNAAQAQTAASQATRNMTQAMAGQGQAANAAAGATRQHAAAANQSARSTQMSAAALRAMGQQMASLAQQRRALMATQRQQGQLDRQQAQQLQTLRLALRALTQQYVQLNASQRQQVMAARQVAQAQQQQAQTAQQTATASRAAAQGMNQMATATRTASTGMREFDSASNEALFRLFALRSAGEDLSQGLQTMAFATQRAFQTVWDAFSTQEQTIAHFSRITQESDRNVQGMASSVRELAGEIPLAFDRLGEITILGAQVGIANERLIDFTDTVARFSETTPVAADEAALLFARIVEMTNIDESQIRNLGAAVSELGSNSSATEGEILKVVESIAVVSTQAGLSETTILGLGAALASLRVRPELARGALQRSFHRLGEAAQDGGERVQVMAQMMDLTQDEVADLQATNPDRFFMTLLESINETATGAGDLTSTLRELGVVNIRDVDTISRLAANYDLLEKSVEMANRSFEEGTFLQKESERIFNTITSRVQILRNEWATFGAMAFETIGPIVDVVLDLAIGFANLLQATDPVSSTIVGIAVALTGLAFILSTVGAALTRLGVGFVAFRGIQQQLKQLSNEYQGALRSQTAATNTAAAAAQRVTGVTTAQAAAQSNLSRGMAVATRSQAAYASTVAQTLSAQTAATSAIQNSNVAAQQAVASTRAQTVAMGHLRSAMTVLGSVARTLWATFWPMAVITAGIAAVHQIGEAFKSTETKVKEANEEFFNAAGGMQSLTDAIMEDTVAMNTLAEETGRSTSAFSLRTTEVQSATSAEDDFGRSAQEAANALDIVESSAGMSEAAIRAAANSAEDADPRMRALADRVRGLKEAADESSSSMDGLNVALGTATHEFALASAEAFLMEQDILQTGEAFDTFMGVIEEGGGIGTIVAAELTEAGAGAEYLRDATRELGEESAVANNTFADFIHTIGTKFNIDIMVDDTVQAMDALEGLADNLESTTVFIDEATNATDLFNKENAILSDGTITTTERLRELGTHGFGQQQEIIPQATDAAREYGVTVEDLASSIADFVDPMQAWNDAMEGTVGTTDAAGQSMLDMQANASQHFDSFLTGMDNMQQAQMNWADNLLELSSRVPGDVLAGLAEMGAEGAGIVAGLADANEETTQRFIDDWRTTGGITVEEFSHTFSSFMRMARTAGDTAGSDLVNGLLEEFRAGQTSLQEVGEQSGTAYAMALMEQVREGEISFREATDSMTEYAHENFEGADPTMTAQMETVAVLEKIEELLQQVAEHFGIMNGEAVVEPGVNDTGFRNEMGEVEDFTGEAWERMNSDATVTGTFERGKWMRDLGEAESDTQEHFDRMEEDAKVEPELEDEDYNSGLDRLFGNNLSIFDNMREGSWTDPELRDGSFLDTLFGTRDKNFEEFGNMRGDSWTEPEILEGLWNSGLGSIDREHSSTISSIQSVSRVAPRLLTGGFIGGLFGLISVARSVAAQLRSILTVSANVRGSGGVPKADGGWVSGPGGPRDDRIPHMLSNGEFVVQASKATQFGPLLEAINGGQVSPEIITASVPDFVPDDIMSAPRQTSSNTMPPSDILSALNGVRDGGGGRAPDITINNTYPQAEPTSVTINKGLAYAGALDGVS